MRRYLARRLLTMLPVLFGVVTLSFLLMRIAPGDPAVRFLGNRANPTTIAALRHQWGLDKPIAEQYLSFVGGLFKGDLGQSLYYRTSITSILGTRLPVTLLLMLFATVISVAVSVPLGMLAASKKNSWIDEAIRLINAVGLGMPSFWFGYLLIIVFALKLSWFDVAGYGDSWGEHFKDLILPAITVSITMIPPLVKSLRAAMVDANSSEYVEFARAKGLSGRSITARYSLRNAAISGVSVLGINVGYLAGGALVIENVFALPGMGDGMMKAILNRDFPLVQICTLIFGLIVVVVYLLTDIAYSLLDPRVRRGNAR